jgi:DNA-binding NtrC family response regulator
VIPLLLPSLRERIEDIPLLVDHFLKRAAGSEYKGNLGAHIEEQALRKLQSYEWPGNVRELENVIERANIIREGDRIAAKDLPMTGTEGLGGENLGSTPLVGGMVTLDDLERAHILGVLEATGGARKQTSEILGINASTLYRKLKKYGVQDGEGEDQGMENEGNVDGEALLDAVESVIRESEADKVPEPAGS